jgi:uncharacterized protein (TIGR04255 family)
MLSYQRPPITEAVLQLNFANQLDRADIEKVAAAVGSGYQKSDELNFQFVVNPAGSVSGKTEPTGIRLTHPVLQQLIIIYASSISVSRLAPYPGWDAFYKAGSEVFSRVRKRMGYRQITRAAVRYVNRIDIPHGPDNNPSSIGDYLRVYYSGPTIVGMSAPSAYMTQAEFGSASEWAKVIVRVLTVEPALIRHSSVVLDLDVYCDKGIPQQEAELEKFFTKMRHLKNSVFTDCITPAAEQLFGGRS